MRSAGEVSVTVDGAPVLLGPDEVIVTQTPRSGWTVATEGGETVALEVAITPELRREGLAREVIRLVQDGRKSDGLHVSDRIRLWWQTADPELAAALTEHASLIASEVLAVEFSADQPGQPGPAAGRRPSGAPEAPEAGGAAIHEHTDQDLGLTFWLRRA